LPYTSRGEVSKKERGGEKRERKSESIKIDLLLLFRKAQESGKSWTEKEGGRGGPGGAHSPTPCMAVRSTKKP